MMKLPPQQNPMLYQPQVSEPYMPIDIGSQPHPEMLKQYDVLHQQYAIAPQYPTMLKQYAVPQQYGVTPQQYIDPIH